MASGKPRTVGGVKRRAAKPPGAVTSDSSPAAAPAPAPGTRTVGGVKANPRGTGASVRSVQSCPENCPGEWAEGNWIHSRTCRWASVLWRSHGFTEKDWNCPYGCPPQVLPSGWTHQHNCRFWEVTGRTPFDHANPFNPGGPGKTLPGASEPDPLPF